MMAHIILHFLMDLVFYDDASHRRTNGLFRCDAFRYDRIVSDGSGAVNFTNVIDYAQKESTGSERLIGF